jgi:group II intron reverse transcriptase/maturase
MLPFEAQPYLDVVRKRGEARQTLNRVYYNMTKRQELYLAAYAHLYANEGALTPGIAPEDPVDGMSLQRIETIRDKLKEKTYEWKPARRIYILKQDGKRKRPVGMPGWNDKMLEEVIRMILSAYYEPQFRESSHGFRPNRGCHTALSEISQIWSGVKWFIEGDIKGCFDNLNHQKIVDLLKKNIKDEQFLGLIEGMLHAGYFEDWVYHQTYSGTPQGGILSPLLANIVLNELDTYVEERLIPRYTKGKKRRGNKEHQRLRFKAWSLRKKGDYIGARAVYRRYSHLPSLDCQDPNYRRLYYIRYADDFLLGFIGAKAEAEVIKTEIGKFLKEQLLLEMSPEKTLITNATEGRARFLNYEITIAQKDNRQTKTVRHGIRTRTRGINGQVIFLVPKDVIKNVKAKVIRGGNARERAELIHNSDYEIISTYERQLQGVINYYLLAHNVSKEMWKLRYYFKTSLLKTLAAKHKTSTSKIRRKYTKQTADGRKVIAIAIQREGKRPLRAIFGAKPIQRKTDITINDNIQNIYMERSELIERLLAGKCELCEREGEVIGHHIHKLKNLRKKKRTLETWEKKMIAMRRKSLFVCEACHKKIHNGTYDGRKLTQA